jgi:hypothetical protein
MTITLPEIQWKTSNKIKLNVIQIPIRNKVAQCAWKTLTQTPTMAKYPNCDVATLTGKVNQLVVVDIDIVKPHKTEKDGMKAWAKMLCSLKEPLNTRVVSTPSGGLHYYFKYCPSTKTSAGVNGYSIAVRTGVVCPPSKKYTLRDDHPICEMPTERD